MCLTNTGTIGAVVGGVLGGVKAGNRAVNEGESNFWTGKKTLDTSKGVGAHTTEAKAIVEKGSIMGKYVGKYNDIKIYESSDLGMGEQSGGLTLPPNKIIVGTKTYSYLTKSDYVRDLFRHEFGHILQYRLPYVGLKGFYSVIAPESLASATFHGWNALDDEKHIHDLFWTEKWANYLSNEYYHGNAFINVNMFPAENISSYNMSKFILGFSTPKIPIFYGN